MLRFNIAKPALLGVDIGSTSVKLVALSKSQETLHITHYARAPLPQGAVIDKSPVEIETIAAVIAQALKRSGCIIKHAAVAVPATAAVSRVLSLPADLDSDELEAHVELEAERCIPYPLNEIRFDFEVIGKNAANVAKQDVLLVAARIEPVEDRIAVLEMAGLKARIVDIETYAIENTVEILLRQRHESHEYTTVAIADIGALTINFQAIVKGKTIYSREEPLSAALDDAPDEKSTASTLAWLIQQIKRSLQFFQASGHTPHLELLVLSGGRALCAGLAAITANELGLATLVCNPYSAMSYEPRIDYNDLQGMAPTLTIACGLALRAFDQ